MFATSAAFLRSRVMRTEILRSSHPVSIAAFALFGSAVSARRARVSIATIPSLREPESQDASRRRTLGARSSCTRWPTTSSSQPGYKPSGLRAQNLNTIDEVPDSSWFTNRVGARPLTHRRDCPRAASPGRRRIPRAGSIFREKTSGGHPGITAKDANGRDLVSRVRSPQYYPEAATAAVVIATKFFWALGYNQVESFLTTFDPKRMEFDPEATIRRPNGKRTPFTRDDIDESSSTPPAGRTAPIASSPAACCPARSSATSAIEGTRPDDPNDLVPHEHRRELRALRVFGAWTNLTDLKANNTLDTLRHRERPRDRQALAAGRRLDLRHVQRPARMGPGLGALLSGRTPRRKRLLSFGFALSPWQTVNYTEGPSIGKFEGDRFDPRTWRPQTPTTAYMELRDDDAFWAARRVAGFSDEMIRAIVHTGEFSDPAAEKAIGDIMIKRRDKILRTYLPAVNPIVTPRLEAQIDSPSRMPPSPPTWRRRPMLSRRLVPVRQCDRRDPAARRDDQRDHDDRRAATVCQRRRQFHPGRDLGGQQGTRGLATAGPHLLPS